MIILNKLHLNKILRVFHSKVKLNNNNKFQGTYKIIKILMTKNSNKVIIV